MLKSNLVQEEAIQRRAKQIEHLEEQLKQCNKEITATATQIELNTQLAQRAMDRATDLGKDEIFDLTKAKMQTFINDWAVFESKIDQRY